MIEHKLVNVNFSVTPIPGDDEQKQINFFHQPTQTVYIAPFTPEALKVLVDDLTATNAELEKRLEQRRVEAELAVNPAEVPDDLVIPGQ